MEDRSGVLSLDKGMILFHLFKVLYFMQETFNLTHSLLIYLLAVHLLDYNNIGKFLNRILGMEVQQQNALFQYFSDTLNAVVLNAKKNGRYDMGILGEIRFSCDSSVSTVL